MPSFSGVWSLPAQMQAIGGQLWPMGPGAPTSVSATAGDASATVSFTAPTFTGVPAGITGYLATSNPGGFTATGASSPLTVTGLTNGTAYTFEVQATNGVQYGPAGTSGSVSPAATRGIFVGSGTNVAGYITVSTTGNATSFGQLSTTNAGYGCACASSTRGIFSSIGQSSVMQYVTIATTGNSTAFGNLTQAYLTGAASCNSATRGIIAGGRDPFVTAARQNVIQYVTIATTGNAIDYGDLTSWTGGVQTFASCSSPTRGIFAGGQDDSLGRSYINYITIASTGNSTFFGNLVANVTDMTAGCSNDTRGVFGGGNSAGTTRNTIQYITIATTGNAVTFGELTQAIYNSAALASSSRAVFGGGSGLAGGLDTNVMSYVTIASTGNAIDFGDLLQAQAGMSACSNGNGGVQ